MLPSRNSGAPSNVSLRSFFQTGVSVADSGEKSPSKRYRILYATHWDERCIPKRFAAFFVQKGVFAAVSGDKPRITRKTKPYTVCYRLGLAVYLQTFRSGFHSN